jgi:hypothetical protein
MAVKAVAAFVALVILVVFKASVVEDSAPTVVAMVLWLLESLKKIDVALPVKTDEPL